MKKTFIGIAVGAALLTASLAVVAKPHGANPFPGIEMLKSLDLDQTQKREIRAIVKAAAPEKGERRDRFAQRRQAMLNMLQNGPLSDEEIESKVEGRVESMLTKHAEMAEVRHQIWQVLNGEQQAELVAMIPEQRARQAKKPKPDLSSLELTQSQQQALEEIKAKREDLHEQGKALRESFREQEVALIRQASFDQDQWQALVQDYKPQMIEHGKALASLRAEFFDVLDDEQKVAFVDQMLEKQQSRWSRMKEKMKRKGERRN